MHRAEEAPCLPGQIQSFQGQGPSQSSTSARNERSAIHFVPIPPVED